MAGRPQLEIGTYGRIRHVHLDDGRVQARCLYRDHDGKTRPITRIGPSAAAADRALKVAIRDRQRATGSGSVRSDMRINALADVWLASIDDRVKAGDLAIQTKQQYEKMLRTYLHPRMGAWRLQEATVSACNLVIKEIAARHGRSVARSARSTLSGMLGYAARHDALPANPVRDTEPIAGASKPKKGKPRSLAPDEVDSICDGLRAQERANALDIPDLVDFMLATGCRIGEALACRVGVNSDGEPLLDLDAGTWEVNATLVRVAAPCVTCGHSVKKHRAKLACVEKACRCEAYVKPDGSGLVVQERTKSDAGWRVLALPAYCVEMLKGRMATPLLRGPQGVVFGSPHRRSLRDPNNCEGDIRECLDALGDRWSWVTSHTFRKTVATRMRDAGCTDTEVADQLGHANPSMTRNVYFGRQVTSARAAEVLDR